MKMNFYPRPPRGGRHDGEEQEAGGQKISIHALREEGDGGGVQQIPPQADFYPRPPRGGRQITAVARVLQNIFLSTPSARRATVYPPHRQRPGNISIHALREEGDLLRAEGRGRSRISIHALREEGDARVRLAGFPCFEFLSTPSARRATLRVFSRG